MTTTYSNPRYTRKYTPLENNASWRSILKLVVEGWREQKLVNPVSLIFSEEEEELRVLTYRPVFQILCQLQSIQNPDIDLQTLKFLQAEFLYRKKKEFSVGRQTLAAGW